MRAILIFVLAAGTAFGAAQPWSGILPPGTAIDWSSSGVGTIPTRTVNCATIKPPATAEQINAALAACPRNQTVYLAPGIYTITGSIRVPSYVTLRGAGAGRTIVKAVGIGVHNIIAMGDGWVPYNPIHIVQGATAGSTRIFLSDANAVRPGSYLVITETNDPRYVSSNGSEGTNNWTDAGWTNTGSLARGQIVEVTSAAGERVRVEPALYSDYKLLPIATPFSMDAQYAGVEDLQVYATNTGYEANFSMSACAHCWLKGVESNYADGDHVRILWGFRDEVRDSYFSNAFQHQPGPHDADIRLAYKTSASLVENNIIERAHHAILVQYGPAGNVIAYNFTTGEFDSGAPDLVLGGVFVHGAHPQYNLLEGNVLTKIDLDSSWGTSSHSTIFRNWVIGTNRICSPLAGRGPVECSGSSSHYGFQSARAIQLSYLSTWNNFLGNIVGSSQMQSLTHKGKPLRQFPSVEYPALRDYEASAYGWSFGYGKESDDGRGDGCSGGVPPCHESETAATNLLHGNFNNVNGSSSWATGITRDWPPSFYLLHKPAWWGDLPFPSTGPEVIGGFAPQGHSYGNPAERCYFKTMSGVEGGQSSPLAFDAHECYQ